MNNATNIKATNDKIYKLEKSITFSYDVIYNLRNNKLHADAYDQDVRSIRRFRSELEFERETVKIFEAELAAARLFLAECQK